MFFGNFRVYSVKDRKCKKRFGCLPENVGCIPSAVVIMTTADGMHPAFSGKHPNLSFKFPIFTDLHRLLTEIAEVHFTPVTLKKHPSIRIKRRYHYLSAKLQ